MTRTKIQEKLFALQDEGYQAFSAKLIPTVAPAKIIGVRTPALRQLAKEIMAAGEAAGFLEALPHLYHEENQLHAFILSAEKDFDRCLAYVDAFFPYVDNWATCDQMSPKVFSKHRPELLLQIKRWLAAEDTYAVRFAIGMLMAHFLDEDFDRSYLAMTAQIRSEEYYVNMMIAWYFATALAKQYEEALPVIENKQLAPWTHNKAIQKACESRRVSAAHKEHLRTLKIKTF
ncbi:3-methyladenine DNA glycosylase AlkD [Selenomonas ruminantium]|uniref:3-methyladenine DNA glycosylase AlkD n=1 Tax=Selenomonas ruminantium TaxID=971 RepID=A0A1I3BRP5_SELRU|nr:DNA alkylation repair protein [Selenomonas ruminantium]SFH64756.1 3-methyladenine DNA glycosylase AlkD [Selenomonas ruminantium]